MCACTCAAQEYSLRVAAVMAVAGVTYLITVSNKQGENEKQLKAMEIERGERWW